MAIIVGFGVNIAANATYDMYAVGITAKLVKILVVSTVLSLLFGAWISFLIDNPRYTETEESQFKEAFFSFIKSFISKFR